MIHLVPISKNMKNILCLHKILTHIKLFLKDPSMMKMGHNLSIFMMRNRKLLRWQFLDILEDLAVCLKITIQFIKQNHNSAYRIIQQYAMQYPSNKNISV